MASLKRRAERRAQRADRARFRPYSRFYGNGHIDKPKEYRVKGRKRQ